MMDMLVNADRKHLKLSDDQRSAPGGVKRGESCKGGVCAETRRKDEYLALSIQSPSDVAIAHQPSSDPIITLYPTPRPLYCRA